jgi:hypothetical protein
MSDFYNDAYKFIRDTFVVPMLPPNIATHATLLPYLQMDNWADDPKTFAMMHYGIVKKACEDEKFIETIRKLRLVTMDTSEGNELMTQSIEEVRKFGLWLNQVSLQITESTDEEIRTNLEKACLYTEIITKQFIK